MGGRNSAERLADLLRKGKTLSGPALAAWGPILGVGGNDKTAYLAAVVDLVEQADELIATFRQRDHPSVVHLERIRKSVLLPLGNVKMGSEGVRDQITADLIAALDGLAWVMSTEGRDDPDPDEADVDELRRMVVDLIDALTNLDADDYTDELQAFLLEHLHAVQGALDALKVRGVRGARDAIARMIGDLATNPDLAQELDASPIWTKVGKMIGTAATMFTFSVSMAIPVPGAVPTAPTNKLVCVLQAGPERHALPEPPRQLNAGSTPQEPPADR